MEKDSDLDSINNLKTMDKKFGRTIIASIKILWKTNILEKLGRRLRIDEFSHDRVEASVESLEPSLE